MPRRAPAQLALLALLLLAFGAAPAAADCSPHPADVAPGVLVGGGPVPTWTVFGDGSVDVQDVLALLRAAVDLQTLVWSAPVSPGCPLLPGDVAPGALNQAFTPPRWTPNPDGDLNVGDVLAVLQMSVRLTAIDPSFVRPVVADGRTDDRVLTGTVRDSVSSLGLPGVTVTASVDKLPVGSTRTDEKGVFLLQALPAGLLSVSLDGSTSTAAQGKFSSLKVQVDTAGEGTTALRGLSLPNEEDPAGAAGKLASDASGTVEEEIALSSDDGSVGIATGPGSKVTVDDQPVEGEVDLSVVPLDGDELPGKLTDESTGADLNSTGLVAVSPAAGKFQGGGGAGAALQSDHEEPPGFDLRLPNRKGLPIGTLVDIWYWDGELGRWRNLTAATGRSGEVIDRGDGETSVFAAGVATQGGLHAAALAIDPACTTRLSGRVVDADGLPLSGVVVDSTLGPFERTDEDGRFVFEMLPAYAGPGEGSCTGIGFGLNARAPVELGAVETSRTVDAMDVSPGTVLDVGDLVLQVPDEGCLSGLVLQNDQPVSGPVRLSGPESGDLLADEQGRFSASGLDPGDYRAAFLFPGDFIEREFRFDIAARECQTVRLQSQRGTGSRRVEVQVLLDHDRVLFTPASPVPGALVELRGSDAGSAEGLQVIADENGRAIFDGVSGPFEILAQAELQPPGALLSAAPESFARLGAALTTDASSAGQVALFLRPPRAWQEAMDLADGEIGGRLLNAPRPGTGESLGVTSFRRGWLDPLAGNGFDEALGRYLADAFVEPSFDIGVFLRSSWPPHDLRRVRLFGPFQLPDEGPPVLERDLDWSSAPTLDFDRELSLVVRFLETQQNERRLEILAKGANGRGFRAALADVLFPERVRVPQATQASAQGLHLALLFESEPEGLGGEGQSCLVPLPAPLAFQVDVSLLPVPTLTQGPLGLEVEVDEIAWTPFGYSSPSQGSLPGFDILTWEQPYRMAGPGEPSWTVFLRLLPGGSSGAGALGKTPDPFVFPDADLYFELALLRSTALPQGFSSLFGHALNGTLSGLPAAGSPVCGSRTGRLFEVVAGDH